MRSPLMPGSIWHKDRGIRSSTRNGIRGLRFEKLEDRMALSGVAATYAEELRLVAPHNEVGSMDYG
ncbi:MAG: hypothetical protein WC840_05230, partial [Candidatus Peribacteraceae bacterium]